MNDMESNEFYRFAKSLGVDSNLYSNHDKYLRDLEKQINSKFSKQNNRLYYKKNMLERSILRIENLKSEISKIEEEKKEMEENLLLIQDDFDKKPKAKKLISKHKDVISFYQDDFGAFFVWGDFPEDDENDPYHDEHLCTTWAGVFERVSTYIKLSKK